MLIEGKVPFTCSCKYDRFKGHVERLRGPNHVKDNVKGESMAMHRPTTGEVFVYAYDTQLNEAKYNMSWGFTIERNSKLVKKRSGEIPIYSYYKAMFNSCDIFNRALHDKTWCYKRGGAQTKGDLGRINDFYMGVILQNTFNMWYEVNSICSKSVDFRNLCDILSYSLYLESLPLEDEIELDDNDTNNDEIDDEFIIVGQSDDEDD
jgi:hypothetical protein